MKRNNRVEIAKETIEILEQGFYRTASGEMVEIKNEVESAVKNSRLFRPADFPAEFELNKAFAETNYSVTDETTIDAIRHVCKEDENANPFVLNFASAKNPGGGFLSGAQAQEESLARSSALYSSLTANFEMYEYNRRHSTPFYSDYLIYSPQVPVFRHDDGSFFEKPFLASFLTAPAVNAGVVKQKQSDKIDLIETVNRERARKLLWVANQNNHKLLVLGAWGCGVFQNEPKMIASIFADLLNGEFSGCFERIVFAVYDTSTSKRAFNAFVERFDGK